MVVKINLTCFARLFFSLLILSFFFLQLFILFIRTLEIKANFNIINIFIPIYYKCFWYIWIIFKLFVYVILIRRAAPLSMWDILIRFDTFLVSNIDKKIPVSPGVICFLKTVWFLNHSQTLLNTPFPRMYSQIIRKVKHGNEY